MTEVFVYGLPVLIYVAVQARRIRTNKTRTGETRSGLRIALRRIGFTWASPVDYLWAALLSAAQLALFVLAFQLIPAAALDSPDVVFPLATTISVTVGIIIRAVLEEVFFRGLLAGVLQRRLEFWWGNLTQAVIFLLPHLVLLAVDSGLWPILPVQFLAGFLLGWLRHRSGSFVPGALCHAAVNLAAPALLFWLT